MAFREVSVTEVLEVLRQWQRGHGLRTVSELVGVDRKTVRRYVAAAQSLGISQGGDVEELTDEVLGQVLGAVRPGRTAAVGDMRMLCREHQVRIEAWLSDDIIIPKVRTLLHRFTGVLVPERTLMRFVSEELHRSRQPSTTVRVADGLPGHELQMDFCDLGFVVDPETQRRRKLQALLFTPVVSRYAFVWLCWDQRVETVIEGLEAAWAFYGGVFHVVVPDNFKAIVTRADALNPSFCQAFVEYSQSRGFTADPARVRSPQDKGRVERNVRYLQGSLLPGERFMSLEEAQRMATTWCSDTAGLRDHGTTHRQPAVDFAERELAALLPAPTSRYDVPEWVDVTVQRDHTITVRGSMYSMPTRYIGESVRVHVTRSTLKVRLAGVVVKTCPRVARGQSLLDPLDYPHGTAELALRDGATLLKKARSHGASVGTYVERLQAGPAPWRMARHVYRLLGLCETYGSKQVESACHKALELDVIDVHRVSRMLEQALEKSPNVAPPIRLAPVVPLRFARSPDEFSLTTAAPPPSGDTHDHT